MTKNEVKKAPRLRTENQLRKYVSEKNRSGFVYFRGRRRVGKTTLLKKLQSEGQGIFYFTGIADESTQGALARFAKEWDLFCGERRLSKIKKGDLDWVSCFDEITAYAKIKSHTRAVVIIFDEIQWLAKSRSGFVGMIKDKWIDWEATRRVKVIVCGSSNKFFVDQTGGEEKILRGLRTHADIVLEPLSPLEVRNYYFSEWTTDEVLMTYMMLGGIPYYLNQIRAEHGFMRAINEALFTQGTIFLSEVDEILNLDFNKAGVRTVKKILSALGVQGGTMTRVMERTMLSGATLSELVHKLHDYEIVKEYQVVRPSSRKTTGVRYFYTDPYLLFYFACIEQNAASIENNEKSLLLSTLIASEKSLYIAQFSGRAFEIMIRNLLQSRHSEFLELFLSALGIYDRNYTVYDSLSVDSAGDLVVEHEKLRTYFVIECKWSQSVEIVKEGLSQLAQCTDERLYHEHFRIERIVVTNCATTKALKAMAKEHKVTLVSMKELLALTNQEKS